MATTLLPTMIVMMNQHLITVMKVAVMTLNLRLPVNEREMQTCIQRRARRHLYSEIIADDVMKNSYLVPKNLLFIDYSFSF